jgi:Icc-related predicted phosphoesterase
MTTAKDASVWFVSDLRGSSDTFGKVLNVVRHLPSVAKRPDIVLLSGNLLGGELCVIGTDDDGVAYADFRGEHCRFANELQRSTWTAVVEKTLGGYVVQQADMQSLSLDTLRIARLTHWLSLVKRVESNKQRKARFLVVPGPHDPPDIERHLATSPGIEFCDNRAVDLNSELSLACSSALTYPEVVDASGRPRHYMNDQAAYIAHINGLMSRPPNSKTRWVLNLHMPPKNTLLDRCQQRDEKGAPILGPNGPEMCHVGSESVRQCIEKFKPVASLHNYPPYDYITCRIGETRGFLAGTEAYQGQAAGTWLIFHGGRLADYEPTKEDIVQDRLNDFLLFSEEAIAVFYKKPLELAALYRKKLGRSRADDDSKNRGGVK